MRERPPAGKGHASAPRPSAYSPPNQGATFLWTGELRFFAAASYEVGRDGRWMLTDDGAGRLSWAEVLGHRFTGPESKAGRITSFEFVIDAMSSSPATRARTPEVGPPVGRWPDF